MNNWFTVKNVYILRLWGQNDLMWIKYCIKYNLILMQQKISFIYLFIFCQCCFFSCGLDSVSVWITNNWLLIWVGSFKWIFQRGIVQWIQKHNLFLIISILHMTLPKCSEWKLKMLPWQINWNKVETLKLQNIKWFEAIKKFILKTNNYQNT